MRKIEFAKKLFVLDLEKGSEVFLNTTLNQDNFPINFRYYDSILNYVQQNVTQSTIQFFKFKNSYRLNFFKSENIQQKVMEKFGFSDNEKPDDPLAKLTFKHSVVN